ncbi:MAG: hypothetical protein V1743_04015 [Nanoarchaeota archaeon]
MKTPDFILTLVCGTMTALFAYASADNILSYNSARDVFLESRMYSGSALTKKTLDSADEDARQIALNVYGKGILSAGLAGLLGGVTLLYATRREEDE